MGVLAIYIDIGDLMMTRRPTSLAVRTGRKGSVDIARTRVVSL